MNIAPKSALNCGEFNLFLRELKSRFEKGEQCGFWEQLVRPTIILKRISKLTVIQFKA